MFTGVSMFEVDTKELLIKQVRSTSPRVPHNALEQLDQLAKLSHCSCLFCPSDSFLPSLLHLFFLSLCLCSSVLLSMLHSLPFSFHLFFQYLWAFSSFSHYLLLSPSIHLPLLWLQSCLAFSFSLSQITDLSEIGIQ